eukprot:1649428-Pleurochrysis_carterae.AAC.1
MTEGWRGGGPGDLRTPTPDPISLERGLGQPVSTDALRLRSCNDHTMRTLAAGKADGRLASLRQALL